MISTVFKAVASYFTYVGQNVSIDDAVEPLTPNSSTNHNMPSTANASQSGKDDIYIPWLAPASRVRIMPDMLLKDNFVFSHDEVLYDVPLDFCDRKLPSPDEVRAASLRISCGKPHIVFFPSLNVVVKFGRRPTQNSSAAASYTSLSEAQCLYTIRRFLGKRVPVPEIYACIHDGADIFLYMELVQGVTLLECWADLSNEAKMDVCAQLKPMMQALRELEQDPSDPFIGTISRQPPQDVMFEYFFIPEPFKSVTAFHDYFSNPRNRSTPHRFRDKLCDNQQICFTHGDINKTNIIVSPPSDGPIHIRAIIDWHQSGWYPANWEYCKARQQVSKNDLWQRHLSEFLESWPWFGHWVYFAFAFL